MYPILRGGGSAVSCHSGRLTTNGPLDGEASRVDESSCLNSSGRTPEAKGISREVHVANHSGSQISRAAARPIRCRTSDTQGGLRRFAQGSAIHLIHRALGEALGPGSKGEVVLPGRRHPGFRCRRSYCPSGSTSRCHTGRLCPSRCRHGGRTIRFVLIADDAQPSARPAASTTTCG